LNDEIDNYIGERGLIEKKLKQLTAERDGLEKELEKNREKREGCINKQNEIKDELRVLKSKKSSLNSEIQLLKELASSNEVFPGGVKFLIDKYRYEFKELTTVSEILNTDEKHAVALEAALGETLNYL